MKLSQADFKQRRNLLAQHIGSNSIAIIATRAEMYRNRDADYKYRADSSFYYLTGFAEPEAVAVIETFAEGEEYSYSLFCRERNREMEIWNGYRAGIDGAIEIYDADEAYAIDLLDEEIIDKLLNKQRLYYRIGQNAEFDARVSQWIQKADAQQRRGGAAPAEVVQLDRIVDEMRLKKSAKEIELMQIASNISAEAHTRAMQTVKPNVMEYALEAELNYIFGKNGCVPAYNSIVGGGENACILHYVENNKPLKDINQDSLKKHIILVEEHESFIPGSIKEVLNCEDEERILHVLLSLTGERLIELGDSPITSQGLPLSLGEQQILSLARALLCDGDIYILDEALSHLSFERKEIIIRTLFETYPEKLFMVISHDKKIMNMGYDYVIMKKGKIIEKG